MRTPRWATWRIRSSAPGSAPSASCTSSEWAQVSMKRAVAIEVGRHRRAEPRHLLPGRVRSRSASASAVAAVRQRASSVGAAAPGRRSSAARVDEARRGRASAASTRASQAALSVAAASGGLVGPGEVGDLGGDVPAGRRGRRPPAVLVQVGDQRVEPVALGREVGEHLLEQVSFMRAASSVRSRVRGPLVEDPAPAAGVVGDGGGQAEAAHQVEGRLHELADAGPGLVDAERLDREPVGLAADPLLERRDRGQQGLVGAGGDPQLEGRGEDRRAEVVAEHPQHRPGPAGARAGTAPSAAAELGAAQLGEVLDRGDDQVVLGREVVELGARGDTPARSETSVVEVPREAALDEQLDRRLQQPQPHRAGAVGLGHPGRRRSPAHRGGVTNKQSSLTV